MYSLAEIKSFAEPSQCAISKEIGEGIIRTFNPALAKALSTAAKPYFDKVCIEVAIANYRANGITNGVSVELIAIRYLYDKLPLSNRRQLLKFPLLNTTRESVLGWISQDIIKGEDPTKYKWEIEIPEPLAN